MGNALVYLIVNFHPRCFHVSPSVKSLSENKIVIRTIVRSYHIYFYHKQISESFPDSSCILTPGNVLLLLLSITSELSNDFPQFSLYSTSHQYSVILANSLKCFQLDSILNYLHRIHLAPTRNKSNAENPRASTDPKHRTLTSFYSFSGHIFIRNSKPQSLFYLVLDCQKLAQHSPTWVYKHLKSYFYQHKLISPQLVSVLPIFSPSLSPKLVIHDSLPHSHACLPKLIKLDTLVSACDYCLAPYLKAYSKMMKNLPCP